MNQVEKDLNTLIVTLKDEKVISTKNISDKWHTFGDLYNHRMAFTIALANTLEHFGSTDGNGSDVYCYKSWKHHNNEKDPMFEGSFIVVFETPNGQISYHYKAEHWDKFHINEYEEANKYDGHTPDDTIVRLMQLF